MIIAIAVALMIMAVAIFARLEEKLYETFSDPNWMGFEDREDEGYKWCDNIKNYQQEER